MATTSAEIFNAIAEQCRCSLCKEYLLCGPVRVLPDGSSICGCCTPSNPDTPIYRNLVLEKVLSLITFPCGFKQQGCSERALFGQVTDHETKCLHRYFACPVLLPHCSWEGIGMKLFDHFTKEHPDLIKQNAEIKLQIAENAQGVFIVVKNAVTFVFKYFYDSVNSCLRYNVRYCADHAGYDVSFKIQLINDSNPECSTNLKSKPCLLYNNTFCYVQKEMSLDLKKFYENLDYPNCVLFVINLKVVETNPSSLKFVKCGKCCNYLIPPLFSLDGNVVCCECGKTNSSCAESDNEKLLQLVTGIKFPCRWRNCDFMGTSDVYKKHELSCEFRVYRCLALKCSDSFKLKDAVTHYQYCHNAEYLVDKITCKISFSQPYDFKLPFIITNNEVVFLKHGLIKSKGNGIFEAYLYSSDSDVTGMISFEHNHCRLTPKPFSLVCGEKLSISFSQLPTCFSRHDELAVTLSTEQ